MTTTLKTNRRELLAKLSTIESKLSARGITVPKRGIFTGTNALQSRLESLEAKLAVTPSAVKTAPTIKDAPKPIQAPAINTPKSMTTAPTPPQKGPLKIEPQETDKSAPPSPAASAGQTLAQAIKKASGKSLIELGISTYGQSVVDGMLRSAGPEGIEHGLMKAFYLDSLSSLVPGYNDAYFRALLGAPPAVWGMTRAEQRNKMDRLIVALNA